MHIVHLLLHGAYFFLGLTESKSLHYSIGFLLLFLVKMIDTFNAAAVSGELM